MTHGTSDSLIDEIVAQVLSQLRERSNSAGNKANGTTKPEPVPVTLGQSPTVNLRDQVVTEESLKNHAKPGASVNVSAKAIITPAARDYIRTHRIILSRDAKTPALKTSAPGVSPGVIIASYLSELVQALLAEVRTRWKSCWTVEIEAGNSQVAAKVKSVICRGESNQALVFAKSPHQVACLVNRNERCRAAIVRNAADVRSIREEMQANVLCVDLAQPTYIGLRGIVRASMDTADLLNNEKRSQS